MKIAKNRIIAISVIILCIAIANIPVTTRQGIDYEVRVFKIPLYIKAIEFIDRDYHYKKLVGDIIKGKAGDKARILTIFDWVGANIATDIPAGWPVYDDHVLNIIIRRYGTSDQVSDVFATLATYAGYPSIVRKITVPDSAGKFCVTLVDLNGRTLVFDPYFKNYFLDDKSEIATPEYIKQNYPRLVPVNPEVEKIQYKGVRYMDYFRYLASTQPDFNRAKAYRQMPGMRFIYELRKLTGPQ